MSQLDTRSPALIVTVEPEGAALSSHFPSRHSLMVALQLLGQEAAAPGTRLGLISSSSGRQSLLRSWASLTGSLEPGQPAEPQPANWPAPAQERRVLLVAQDIGLDDKPLESFSFPSLSLAMSGGRKERGGIGSQRGTGSHFGMVVRIGRVV